MPPRRIDIGICTFRRPGLTDTLSSIMALDVPEDLSVTVIVADNDTFPSARERVEAFAVKSRFPVKYIHSPESNISIARNACLDMAQARYMAFIDDDEIADRGWLSALVKTMASAEVAAVFGPVDAKYPSGTPGWIREGDLHSTRPVWVKGEMQTGYSCNVLLDLLDEAVDDRRFAEELGRSGGEDTMFFDEVYKAGGRFAYAETARLSETVPPHRLTYGWLSARRFRMGQTHARTLRTTGRGRAPQFALAALKYAYSLATALIFFPNPAARKRALLRARLHLGVCSGLLGRAEQQLYGHATSPS